MVAGEIGPSGTFHVHDIDSLAVTAVQPIRPFILIPWPIKLIFLVFLLSDLAYMEDPVKRKVGSPTLCHGDPSYPNLFAGRQS